jgi:hypothetical protein
VTWTKEKAFQDLKGALCSGPVLLTPDISKPLVCTTFETRVDAVLSQLQEDEEHPVMYISRKLLPRERRYSTVEKECLAIKGALETLKPLVWMSRNKDSNARITCWFLSLQLFAFSVVHRSGATHGNVDALSRRDALGSWRME